MPKRLSGAAVRLLKAIGELGTGPVPVAQVQTLAERLGKKRGAVAKMLHGLKEGGFVENPVWGGYRLTSKGRRTLSGFRSSTREVAGVDVDRRRMDEAEFDALKRVPRREKLRILTKLSDAFVRTRGSE